MGRNQGIIIGQCSPTRKSGVARISHLVTSLNLTGQLHEVHQIIENHLPMALLGSRIGCIAQPIPGYAKDLTRHWSKS
jgi:hypothetical protein